ncbi:putative signal transducing protein [Costertonia aggregata]|uniref:DUF2007 domain-containing protein n=1 Tax=Costertonia aggregata TaxID=343403 RepID=A0A7H9AQA4_9FLAO|nr:DUF2007 domain-containing protein [Costertonia aggregata]QLG45425.1 DUF2007 domain-containing protein [Costertonia aggregata]
MVDKNTYVKIYSGSQVQVILLKGLLEEKGIAVIEKNEQLSGTLAGFVGGTQTTISLSVQKSDEEKAKTIVTQFNAGKENV